MLKILSVFTGLLCVVLLSTLVVMQVQRGLQEAPATEGATGTTGTGSSTTTDDDYDLGEPAGFDAPATIAGIQEEPPIATSLPSPNATTSLVSSPPISPDAPPSLDAFPARGSAPAALAPDPASFPTRRPELSAVLPPSIQPAGDVVVPPDPRTALAAPPTPDPATVPATAPPQDTVATPASASPTTIPPSGQSTTTIPPPAAPSVLDPPPSAARVIELPQPPAILDGPATPPTTKLLPDPPETITPTPSATPTTSPSTSATDADHPLRGTATVDTGAPLGEQQPQLTIAKTAPSSAKLGQPLVYSITVHNSGPTTVDSVLVEDRVPRGARLTGTLPQAEFSEGVLVWSLGTMTPGTQQTIKVRIIPTVPGPIGSSATVRFAAQTSAVIQIEDAAADPVTLDSSLQLRVAAPAEAKIGDVVTLKFTMINKGQTAKSGIVLRNVIPAQFSHPAGNDLEYPLPALASGESKVVVLKVTARTPGRAVNRATLTTGKTIVAREEDTIQIALPPAVKIEQTIPKQSAVGRSTSFKIAVSNTSAQPIGPATLVQTLPPGIDFLNATGTADYDPVNGRVTWLLPTLPAGSTQTFAVAVEPRQLGKAMTSLVRLTSGGKTLASSTRPIKTFGFAAPGLEITGLDAPTVAGEPFAVTVTLVNRGTAPITASQVELALPTSLELVKVSGATQKPTIATDSVALTPSGAKPIAAGGSTTIVLTLRGQSSGQHVIRFGFSCDQLKQPLTRMDVLTTLPADSIP